ncbi:hypothetical protein J4474_02870 [Candidatus Pacearchaeota archaeon]|nr:hypothetical protein [Candidatus Pacearchaeota archaeon]
MNLQFYLEKLFTSKEFENFKKENPDAYLCSGFVVIDNETKGKNANKVHLDYFIPSTKKMFSFQLEKDCEVVPVEHFSEEPPAKMLDNIDFEFEEIEKMIEEKMQKEGITSKIQKILLSLQGKDKNHFLLGTVFISALGMIKIRIDLEDGHRSVYPQNRNSGAKMVDFEKKSLFDIIKRVK